MFTVKDKLSLIRFEDPEDPTTRGPQGPSALSTTGLFQPSQTHGLIFKYCDDI